MQHRGRTQKRDRRGIGYIEMVVSIALFSIIAATAANVSIALLRLARHEQLRAEVHQAAALGVEPIREAAKGANAVLASATIAGTAYTSSAQQVAFSLPAIDAQGALVNGTDMIGFRRDTTDPTLLITETQGAAGSVRHTGKATIARFVDTLTFRYNTSTPALATSLEVYLETAATDGTATIRAPLQTAVRLQNQ